MTQCGLRLRQAGAVDFFNLLTGPDLLKRCLRNTCQSIASGSTRRRWMCQKDPTEERSAAYMSTMNGPLLCCRWFGAWVVASDFRAEGPAIDRRCSKLATTFFGRPQKTATESPLILLQQ